MVKTSSFSKFVVAIFLLVGLSSTVQARFQILDSREIDFSSEAGKFYREPLYRGSNHEAWVLVFEEEFQPFCRGMRFKEFRDEFGALRGKKGKILLPSEEKALARIETLSKQGRIKIVTGFINSHGKFVCTSREEGLKFIEEETHPTIGGRAKRVASGVYYWVAEGLIPLGRESIDVTWRALQFIGTASAKSLPYIAGAGKFIVESSGCLGHRSRRVENNQLICDGEYQGPFIEEVDEYGNVIPIDEDSDGDSVASYSSENDEHEDYGSDCEEYDSEEEGDIFVEEVD